jgi:homogentisate 1,2-dioxygenase
MSRPSLAGEVQVAASFSVEVPTLTERAQRMMVRPGELLVIQRGMRFKVRLPDGPVRGCRSHQEAGLRAATDLVFLFSDIQEIFGSQFELPDLGPLGSHGLANARDFESPVASFDIDQSPWKSTYSFSRR